MAGLTYRCRTCKGPNVQGTLPAWLDLSREGWPVVEVDAEADFESGWCDDCEAGGDFDDIVERIDGV